jgi:hypothetical protein
MSSSSHRNSGFLYEKWLDLSSEIMTKISVKPAVVQPVSLKKVPLPGRYNLANDGISMVFVEKKSYMWLLLCTPP